MTISVTDKQEWRCQCLLSNHISECQNILLVTLEELSQWLINKFACEWWAMQPVTAEYLIYKHASNWCIFMLEADMRQKMHESQ